MKLLIKLLIVVALPAVLIWQVGYYATDVSKRMLRVTIEEQSDSQAKSLMDEIDRAILMHLTNWQAYANSQVVQATLKESNQRFAELEDAESYITAQESLWIKASDGQPTELMTELATNSLSLDLIAWLEKLGSVRGRMVYGEVFVTNAFGVNAAESSLTTDFVQNDEDWWNAAKTQGTFVGEVERDDSSGINAIDLCIGVFDEKQEFLGVLKAVLNIAAIHELIDARAGHGRRPLCCSIGMRG